MKVKVKLFVSFLVFSLSAIVFGQNNNHCNGVVLQRRTVSDTLKPNTFVVYVNPCRLFGGFSGTAFLIHPRVLLTAGHNVAKRKHRGINKVKSLYVEYATKNDIKLHSQSFSVKQNKNIISGSDGVFRYHVEEDWGVIILPDESIYKNVDGYFKLETYNPLDIKDTIHLTGYPAEKTQKIRKTDVSLNYHYNNNVLNYDFETEHGDSGAAIWYYKKGIPTVFAIHTNGDPKNISCGRATIITPLIYDKIIAFCNIQGIDITN
ncbi:hypothetical protein EOD40_17470 [Flavobacterium sufflavum]|uniref:Serine protease n=1 Tax=Flavobacterium sufflavum TaxID=1921138 RepID=A0A437KKM8_9FLAO|nr:hypothetical protein [Flavobacterium sufflavum]RVT71200.1 hypothetical protein EOD40_17470 [Flavobacterium sufflavum]